MRRVLNLFHFDGMLMGILQCEQNPKESFVLFVLYLLLFSTAINREMVLLSSKMTLEAPLGVSKL
jgi:hypothetical protein